MTVLVHHWERRDRAGRDDFALAAERWREAVTAVDGIAAATVYWAGPDTLVTTVDGTEVAIDADVVPEVEAAVLALADAGRLVREERWHELPGRFAALATVGLRERLDLP